MLQHMAKKQYNQERKKNIQIGNIVLQYSYVNKCIYKYTKYTQVKRALLIKQKFCNIVDDMGGKRDGRSVQYH